MNGTPDITSNTPVRFDKTFTSLSEQYLKECQANKKTPTVKAFANSIGTDQHAVWAWALKKRKDEQGNETDQLARPHFHQALSKIDEVAKQEEQDKLNARQELFCQLYATDREFFGNGVQVYIEVYEPNQSKPNWYKNACSSASEMLSNPKVYKRINDLLEDGGLNDVAVDKQLQFLIHQQADFTAKLGAIREYNKLKTRITEKMDHTTNGKDMPTPIYNGQSTKV